MQNWQPTPEQKTQYENEGYFIQHSVISKDLAAQLRGVIRNVLMLPNAGEFADYDPMDPMEDSLEGRIARFRKLANFCIQSPLIWHNIHTSPAMLNIARYFFGDDIVVKFNSCFLKPARTGAATPWHQDNGLWRDGDTEALNFWVALEPATRENGCMQFIPGSHNTGIIDLVLYPDSIHGEIPRKEVQNMIEKHGVHHMELGVGDVVFWHSNMWHYSPPNRSEKSRIATAGVLTNPELYKQNTRFFPNSKWGMKNGEICTQFPPEPIPRWIETNAPLKPFPQAKD